MIIAEKMMKEGEAVEEVDVEEVEDVVAEGNTTVRTDPKDNKTKEILMRNENHTEETETIEAEEADIATTDMDKKGPTMTTEGKTTKSESIRINKLANCPKTKSKHKSN